MTNLQNNYTIGLEFECCARRTSVARMLSELWNTSINEVHAGYNYPELEVKDTQDATWTIHYDCSVNYDGCEVVTPILYYPIDFIEGGRLYQVLDIINRNCKALHRPSVNDSCGLHVHIGTQNTLQDISAQAVKRLMVLSWKYYDMLMNSQDVYNERDHWCKNFETRLIEKLKNFTPHNHEDLKNFYYDFHHANSSSHYSDSRYYLLNLHSLYGSYRHCTHTLEFRFLNGCVDFNEVVSYVHFIVHFTNHAIENTKVSFEPVPTDNDKYCFRRLLCRIGLSGNEYKNTRVSFTKRLQGCSNNKGGNFSHLTIDLQNR